MLGMDTRPTSISKFRAICAVLAASKEKGCGDDVLDFEIGATKLGPEVRVVRDPTGQSATYWRHLLSVVHPLKPWDAERHISRRRRSDHR